MLSQSRRTIPVCLNGSPVPYPTDRTVLGLFEDLARCAPDRTAVIGPDGRLTYQELDDRAAELADTLRSRGVGQCHFVPLVGDSSSAMLIAMIAAMKVGAPFVPIDKAWPRDRIGSTIATLRPRVVLTSSAAEQWPGLAIPTLRVNPGAVPAHPSRNDLSVATVDDLIYGFFTSGSTGTPKCTLNRHLGLLNRFLYMTRRFGKDHVVMQNSSHVFDSSLWQLLWPLTNGSRVVLPRREGVLDLSGTIDTIAQHGVTITDFVPSIFTALVEVLHADLSLVTRLTSLRYLLIGGEEINPKSVHAFRGLLPDVRIINTYGPTECSIGSVFHEVRDTDRDTIPIGRPIDNTYLAVLDESGEPVPIGETGEIYIGGDCVGAGYHNDAEKTAAAFVPNRFPQIPGTLLYRTGDLGFHRSDGLLMFVGRRDQQVKIGGVRIELLEVEAAVTSHPLVRQAKIVIDGAGSSRAMVCFVVADALALDELREHLRRLLPAYCVPHRFVRLDHLPLSPNGKADRAALRAMAHRRSGDHQNDHPNGAALTPAEHLVQDVWSELLGCPDVGRDDDFLDHGGTSLIANKLALMLAERFNRQVSLREILAAPTIRQQAALMSRSQPLVDSERSGQAMHDDRRLPDDIGSPRFTGRTGAIAGPAEPRRVLLTGATGFIGRCLLTDILDRTQATVYCLVRTGGLIAAQDWLDSQSGRYGRERVVTIRGDLAQPHLGLGADTYAELADTVDTVVHAGAAVNLALGYQSLRRANVAGLIEILRLMTRGAPKRLHHLSTVSVFPAEPASEPIPEVEEPWEDHLPTDGYSQSKWVAEKLLALARRRGISTTVYRLGQVMADSRSGVGNPRSALDGVLRACAKLGLCFPTSASTDWTPVDAVSEFIVKAMRSRLTENETLHLFAPSSVPLADVLAALGQRTGLREVSRQEFYQRLRAGAERDHDLARTLALLSEPCSADPDLLAGLFADATELFATHRAEQLAEKLEVTWPSVDDQVLRRYVRQLPIQ